MELEKIVAELKHERSRLDQAISALEGNVRKASIVKATKKTTTSSTHGSTKGRRVHTAASRKLLSEAMKKRWAERKLKSA